MEGEFISMLFGRRRFAKIFSKSILIVMLFFVVIEGFFRVAGRDLMVVISAIILFYLVFKVYFDNEIKEIERKKRTNR